MLSRNSHRFASPVWASTVVACFVVLTISGCSLDDGSGLSAPAAREIFYTTLDATEAALGGSWSNQDDPTPRGCVIPLWQDGQQVPALRVGPAPDEVDVAVATVSDLWSAQGLELATTSVGAVVEVQGTSEVGEVFVLRVSADAMTLQGESECRPTP